MDRGVFLWRDFDERGNFPVFEEQGTALQLPTTYPEDFERLSGMMP
jgi:hypothetical protein